MRFIDDNENLFWNYIKKSGLNLFLGAGFSVLAKNSNNEKLPLGEEIRKKLITRFNIQHSENQSLDKICAIISDRNEDELKLYLKEELKVCSYDNLYHSLFKLPIKNIFTINVDDLIEEIYHSNEEFRLYDTEIYGSLEYHKGIPLYKIHGSVSYPIEKEMTFTNSQIRNLFLSKPKVFQVVSQKLSTAPTLFWGVNISDDGNIIQLLKNSKYFYESNASKWIVVNNISNKGEYIDELKKLCFNIIDSNTEEFLKYINNHTLYEKTDYNKLNNTLEYKFKGNLINESYLSSCPRRPISEFFNGAEPIVSDVLSNNLCKTTYYNRVLNKILSNKNCLIVGIPGSGKSTLLLQLACSDEIQGHKLYFRNLTKIDAELIIKLLKDGIAYIFIDNMSTDTEAVEILIQNNNINVIAADRLLNLEKVKNLSIFDSDNIVDVSEINDNDLINICKKMNRNVSYAFSLKNNDQSISMLEIAISTYINSTLEERISKFVSELREYNDSKIKINLLELFVLVIYVNYCGIPCSMDMLIYYFSEEISDYNDILYGLKVMDKIVVQTTKPEFLEEEQDLLVPRSKLFAEKSLKCINDKSILAKVINKFYDSVDEHAIYRYDIFKKKFYDADITSLAFDINGGKLFYEKLLYNEHNIYIRHQFAIFLQRKGDIELAWKQIDQAYAESKKKVYTISNTHAIMLFDMNINSICNNDNDLIVLKTTLDETFKTLEYCISMDTRMVYHINTYAYNAIRYYEKFGFDGNSENYLKYSKDKIEDLIYSGIYITKFRNIELKQKLEKIKNILKSSAYI